VTCGGREWTDSELEQLIAEIKVAREKAWNQADDTIEMLQAMLGEIVTAEMHEIFPRKLDIVSSVRVNATTGEIVDVKGFSSVHNAGTVKRSYVLFDDGTECDVEYTDGGQRMIVDRDRIPQKQDSVGA
jgi:hypothetical protein